MELPNLALMETFATPSSFPYDHPESTHDECDKSLEPNKLEL
jgi:hypothetical protein